MRLYGPTVTAEGLQQRDAGTQAFTWQGRLLEPAGLQGAVSFPSVAAPSLGAVDAEDLSTYYLFMTDINTRALDRELKRGSAELLILSLLDARPRHGYELAN